MKTVRLILPVFFLAFWAFVIPAQALVLGTDITIYDGTGQGTTGWYRGQSSSDVVAEDQEVEPGTLDNQAWDLEGFRVNGTTLGIVGGWNFIQGDGTDPGGGKILSGDIFIGTGALSNVTYGSGAAGTGSQDNLGVDGTITNSFGYNYVIDIYWEYGYYSVYQITPDTYLNPVYYSQFDHSNPWQFDEFYNSGEGIDPTKTYYIPVEGYQGLQFSYFEGLSDAEAGDYEGDTHNVALFDLSFLDEGTEFTAHFTQECGNDNLMGHGTTVPLPPAVLLLGSGLLGILGFSVRSRRRVK